MVILFFITAVKVSGQPPYFQTLNDENGLPSNEVYRIVQDKKGYIWIGCDAGLIDIMDIHLSRISTRSKMREAYHISNLIMKTICGVPTSADKYL